MSTAAASKHEPNRDGEQLQLHPVRHDRPDSSDLRDGARTLRTLALLGEDVGAGALADLVRTGDADLELVVGGAELLETGRLAGRQVDAILLDPSLLDDDDATLRAGFAQPLEPRLLAQGLRQVADRQRLKRALERRTRELRQSEEQLRSIVRNTADGILVTDGDGVVRFANPAAERLLGLELHELAGRRAPFRVTPCDAQEVEIPGPDGTRLIVEARVTETTWEGTRALLATLHDLTDRRRLENELRQSQKMEAIGQLAGGVAHDFNNLLTAISGYTELLLLKLRDGDPGRRDAEEVRRAAQRAAGLTQQLLAFSRRQMLRPRPLDLNAVIDGMDAMLRRLIGEHIELVSVPAQDLGQVSADPGQLEQVMLNLAVNARDAMPDGGKLVLETANVTLDTAQARRHGVEPGDYVVLAVSDTGCGMDDEIRARIFEPFFTTKEQGKGTGLGLATVYGIVTQSGGAVGVESAPGAGSRFTVLLPRLAVEHPAPAPEPTGTTEALRGTETVLLVEDEDIVRRLAHRVLSEHGYTVLEASYGDEAIQIAARHAGTIHLLVTDVVMPQMSGRELAAAVVRLRPDTRVLYMSGYTDSVFGSAGILDDRTWFLAKPFTPLALARKAREVLDTGSDAPAAFPEPGMGAAPDRGLSGAAAACSIPAVGSLNAPRT